MEEEIEAQSKRGEVGVVLLFSPAGEQKRPPSEQPWSQSGRCDLGLGGTTHEELGSEEPVDEATKSKSKK